MPLGSATFFANPTFFTFLVRALVDLLGALRTLFQGWPCQQLLTLLTLKSATAPCPAFAKSEVVQLRSRIYVCVQQLHFGVESDQTSWSFRGSFTSQREYGRYWQVRCWKPDFLWWREVKYFPSATTKVEPGICHVLKRTRNGISILLCFNNIQINQRPDEVWSF